MLCCVFMYCAAGWTENPVLLKHLREMNALDIELFTWAKDLEVAHEESIESSKATGAEGKGGEGGKDSKG